MSTVLFRRDGWAAGVSESPLRRGAASPPAAVVIASHSALRARLNLRRLLIAYPVWRENPALLADVEVVAEYKLGNVNRKALGALLHKFFAGARLDLELKDRFG